jgi:hypothetical protein
MRKLVATIHQLKHEHKPEIGHQLGVLSGRQLRELAVKSDQKNYSAYVERKIKRLDKDGVRITKAEIIRIGIALRPLVQSVRGTLQDAQNTNRKVLEPTLDNLVRWAKSPGGYDLAGRGCRCGAGGDC